jgi:hypothetical protein
MDRRIAWTVPSLIEAFGGLTAFARAIGVKTQAASEMKRRGRIHSRHWGKILVEGARLDLGLRLRDLLEAQPPSHRKRQK